MYCIWTFEDANPNQALSLENRKLTCFQKQNPIFALA